MLAAEPTLPPELRSRIALVSLIVPGDTMLFRATPGGVFDYRHDGPALPYARRLDDRPVLCISGEDEPGSLCPIWQQHNVRTVALPGDHYLLRDAPLVAATLERGLMDVVERRLTIAAAATPRIPQSAASPRP